MRLFPLILILIISPFFIKAADIVVTSNADSGPGSLRTAIETANSNGTAVHDIIRFNIPATAFLDRVILLTSELPALTSNLTIDGSTQPGESFENTDAKILIKQDQYAPSFASLRISNAKNVNTTACICISGIGKEYSGRSETARQSCMG